MHIVKTKLTRLLVSSVLLAAAATAHGQNVTVNCTGNGGPNAKIKRGRSAPVLDLDKIDEVAGLGNELYSLTHDLPANNIATEQPLHEFYMSGGVLSTRVDQDVITGRQKVYNAGYQLIYQATGTPYYGVTAAGTTTQELSGLPIATNREWTGNQPSNWYPIPAGGYRALFGQKLAAWMQQVEAADGTNKSIWIGNQEPSHTVGFPGGNPSPEEITNNINYYITTWKETALAMTIAGFQVGGIQLNSSNVDEMPYTIDRLKSQSVPFDYITVQQYKPEQENANMLDAIRSSLTSNGYSTAKRVLFNRYNVADSTFPAQAAGYASFFSAERVLLNNADIVYGYCYEGPVWGSSARFRDVIKFLNGLAVNRRPVTVGAGLQCFATSGSAKFTAVVWNPTTSSVAVNALLQNSPAAWDSLTLDVRIGEGSTLTTSTTATWNGTSNRIKDFSLPANSFTLISLQ